MTPYLETSTGRESRLEVKSATRGGGGPPVAACRGGRAASVKSGSEWNSRPWMVSLAQTCTKASSAPTCQLEVGGSEVSSFSTARQSRWSTQPPSSPMAACACASDEPPQRTAAYLPCSSAARRDQKPVSIDVHRAGVPPSPQRFSGTAANWPCAPPCMKST